MKTIAILFVLAFGACSQAAPDRQAGQQTQQSGASTPSLCQEDDPECVPGSCPIGTPPSCCPQSPIVFDMAGDGFDFTDSAHGVTFALAPGEQRPWSWMKMGSDDAWLAMDRNGNGAIDDGSELFGNETPQDGERRDGFHALAHWDQLANGGNHDGRIDSGDAIWPKLVLWTDVDHDGVSQPSELRSLDSVGVLSIGMTAAISEHVDSNGNEYKLKGTVELAPGSKINPTITDVWLQPGTLATPQTCTPKLTCTAWVYIPIGNPLGMRCGTNPGGHGVPVITLSTPGGQLYQAERFIKPVDISAPDSPSLRRELSGSARGALKNLLIGLSIGSCVAAPYPAPDPFGSATEPSSRDMSDSDDWSVQCVRSQDCGGCSFDGGGTTPQ